MIDIDRLATNGSLALASSVTRPPCLNARTFHGATSAAEGAKISGMNFSPGEKDENTDVSRPADSRALFIRTTVLVRVVARVG